MRLTPEEVIAITGASRGIGAAIAEALAPLGVRLALMARSADALSGLERKLKSAGAGDVLVYAADVGDPGAAPRWIEAIVERWGRLDVLVNNAGIGIMKPVDELTDEDWNRTLSTNVTGPFRLIRAAVPAMKRAGGGHIINVSSMAGEVGFAGGGAYCASKFALQGLSECLMHEVRRNGIKVTIVGPGSVDTRFDAKNPSKETAWKIPPDEIARTILYAIESPDGVMPTKIQVRPTLQNKRD